MRLELLSALNVAAGVVQRDAPLPQLRRRVGPLASHLIKTDQRLLDPPRQKITLGLPH